jgi:N-carbamoylputrescine amidase
MPVVHVATTQFAVKGDDVAANVAVAEGLVRAAAARGAQLVLLQELFVARYFCQEQRETHFASALPADPGQNHLLSHFSAVAKELGVALPISFFEKSGAAYFNSLRFIDIDGAVLPGIYRKSHIPDGPGYQEKYYFSPGDTGFKVWSSKLGVKVGVAICWDQWFPEAARAMALQGADIIMYPSAIGSEPQDSLLDSRHHWRRVMQGHSAANVVPVVASNRVGRECYELTQYSTPTRSSIAFCEFVTAVHALLASPSHNAQLRVRTAPRPIPSPFPPPWCVDCHPLWRLHGWESRWHVVHHRWYRCGCRRDGAGRRLVCIGRHRHGCQCADALCLGAVQRPTAGALRAPAAAGCDGALIAPR